MERCPQSLRKGSPPDDEEKKSREMVCGSADHVRDARQVVGGWLRRVLGMGVPVADVIEPVFKDLLLLGGAMRPEREAASRGRPVMALDWKTEAD
jgi:hypothetical protein